MVENAGSESKTISRNPSAENKATCSNREGKKRKGVHFDKLPHEENTASTSDYLNQEGKKWDHVASSFNCDGEFHDTDDNMDELLVLCSWFDKSEATPHHDYYSDDEVSFGDFSSQEYSTSTVVSTVASKSVGTVSTLRFNTKLCLSSSRDLKTGNSISSSAGNSSSESQDLSPDEGLENDPLELAFRGFMDPECGIQSTEAETPIGTQSQREKTPPTTDNFWDDVEF